MTLPALILAASATTQPLPPPEVPAALRPPAGQQSLYLGAFATGVQIYECSQKPDSAYEWVFNPPEASLADRSGRSLGKHYAGPTWESNDGSVDEVKARDQGPKPSAIPWLLLAAKANSGSGILADAKSIQRLSTDGELAPAVACTGANLKQIARGPYTATYYFYR